MNPLLSVAALAPLLALARNRRRPALATPSGIVTPCPKCGGWKKPITHQMGANMAATCCCTPCSICTGSAADVTITFSGITLCTGCVNTYGVPSTMQSAGGTFDGSFGVPIIASAPTECTWFLGNQSGPPIQYFSDGGCSTAAGFATFGIELDYSIFYAGYVYVALIAQAPGAGGGVNAGCDMFSGTISVSDLCPGTGVTVGNNYSTCPGPYDTNISFGGTATVSWGL